ncbi:MAG: stage IV sporulation protein A [Ruminococcaceae bacterium]|nr:stage IV sporulation protein A [Oscillospiraceae bacterium]
MDNNIYKDIAERTGGDIYIGVVGPVRTGKSTFIKQVMEHLVLPNISNSSLAARARDEMPQSASGRTVMTTEPKFIPEEAVNVNIDGEVGFKVKMVDCVGYLIDGALGHTEDGEPRMVMTPWAKESIPFEKAAEAGTYKVITEHSTIGVMITTDGTISEIPRESYIEAEKRVAKELNDIGKPFVIVLNSAYPESEEAKRLCNELEANYNCPVLSMNCLKIGEDEIKKILSAVLYRFPVKELRIYTPSWTEVLEAEHPLNKQIRSYIRSAAGNINNIGEVKSVFALQESPDEVITANLKSLALGDGSGKVEIVIPNSVFYTILTEEGKCEINDERSLIKTVKEFSEIKEKYDKIKDALNAVNETGYGIVTPAKEDLTLEEPEIVKQPGGYGVKLKASAPSIHMIKADIKTEVNPIVGSETQSEELVKFMLKEFEEDPAKLWETNMFGKTLYELIEEGLNTKLEHMPDDARTKLSETLQRIINEGSGGLICILL